MASFSYMVPVDQGNPCWADEARTRIDITVQFPHLNGEFVRYTASKEDPDWPHSEELFSRAAAGEFGVVEAFQPRRPPPPASIPRSSFSRELRKRGVLNQNDALLFSTGVGIPAVIREILDNIDDIDQREDTTILALSSINIDRNHPLINLLMGPSGLGWSEDEIDDFFRCASSL